MQVQQPGTVLGIRARAACRGCNNGWMNKLEQRAKPVLMGMREAQRPDSVITLSPDRAATVAAWTVKTSWIREESAPGGLGWWSA